MFDPDPTSIIELRLTQKQHRAAVSALAIEIKSIAENIDSACDRTTGDYYLIAARDIGFQTQMLADLMPALTALVMNEDLS